jgi:putative transposase
LTEKIVRWIFDDYHVSEHATIRTTPLAKWNLLVADHGIPPVNSFQRLVTLLGEKVSRKISNIGVQLDWHLYASPELEALRCRRGGLATDWQIRIDPYDRGHIWVCDDERKQWLLVPAVHQMTTAGISRYASRCHLLMARKIALPGEPITEQILIEAMRRCDTDAVTSSSKRASRYHANGDLATPVFGNLTIPALIGNQAATCLTIEAPLAVAPVQTAPVTQRTADMQNLFDNLLAQRLASIGATEDAT